MSDENILIKIASDLAKNTEATKNIEKHLEVLNGKVASQESFTRTLQTAVDLNSKSLDGMIQKEERRKDNTSRLAWLTIENIFKLVFGLAVTYLLYRAGIN